MNRTIKTDRLNRFLFETKPELFDKYIEEHRVELFKQLDIKDDQPIVLTFKSVNTIDHPEYISDPLADVELRTTVDVKYPITRQVVITKSTQENYIEHKGFWSKLKLLFSKRPVYMKETKEE